MADRQAAAVGRWVRQGRALPSDHAQHTLLLGRAAISLAVDMRSGGGRHTQQGEQAQ